MVEQVDPKGPFQKGKQTPDSWTQGSYSGSHYRSSACSLLWLQLHDLCFAEHLHGCILLRLLLGNQPQLLLLLWFTRALWTFPSTMRSCVLPEVLFSLYQLNKRQKPLLYVKAWKLYLILSYLTLRVRLSDCLAFHYVISLDFICHSSKNV